ncbi:MAG TPA: S1C family serine protease [Aliidongia sp.]|nr:S1C family serine protease [Aliidongia sp.]
MPDDEIPPELQPNPHDVAFDLARALRAVVGVRSHVPADAFTAPILGTERTGNGVLIRENGLILTIGYLITEAETVWLTTADGRAVRGDAFAYDQETGFGLIQALERLDLPALELGQSSDLGIGDSVILAAAGGTAEAVKTQVVGRETFAGSWEYLLDDALFTAPAHPSWGGAGLIDRDGKLVGIGSLILQQQLAESRIANLNMVVPIDCLKPILDDLSSYGRVRRPARPWLGLYAAELDDSVHIRGFADGGPAELAGLRADDRILAVQGEPVEDLAELWQGIWNVGTAGAVVKLRIARGREVLEVPVRSTDRNTLLKAPRLQ